MFCLLLGAFVLLRQVDGPRWQHRFLSRMADRPLRK